MERALIQRLLAAVALLLVAIFVTVKWVNPPSPFSPEHIAHTLEMAELQYFLDNAHPVTGLVRDRANNFGTTPESNRVASIAATGFGITVLANAAGRGLIERKLARDYTLKTLKFCRDHVERRKGWFLHFVDWETGVRFDRSEFSTIDSTYLVASALYAAQVLKDPEIFDIAHNLYRDIDFWDPLTNDGQLPDKRTLSMAYTVGSGFTQYQWQMYAEESLILLLGLGHPTHPLPPKTWQMFDRLQARLPDGERLMGVDQSLSVHQLPHLWADFRKLNDGNPNLYTNSVIATRHHRNTALADDRYRTFREGFWGFSAGTAPNDGWEAWTPSKHLGFACLNCAVASAMFLPDEVLTDASKWATGPYHDQIWGRYGFVDSLDLDRNWFSPYAIGFTVGSAYLSLANRHEETSVWKDFMRIPEIETAMKRAAESAAQIATPAETPLPQSDSRKPGSTSKNK